MADTYTTKGILLSCPEVLPTTRTRALPVKPVPPVTNTFIGVSSRRHPEPPLPDGHVHQRPEHVIVVVRPGQVLPDQLADVVRVRRLPDDRVSFSRPIM